MKTRLTVTLDEEVATTAKAMARARGVSLSSIIEGALREMVQPPGKTFSQRWRGAFVWGDEDGSRSCALRGKHG